MLESPLRIVGRFPRPVRLLLVGTLVNKLGTFIIPYLTLVLLRDFHMREGEAARLLFAYGAGSVVSILAGGVITDRFGRRRTLLVSLFGSGVLAVAMGLAPSAQLLRAAPRGLRLHRRPLPARGLRDHRRPPALVREGQRLRRPAHGREPRLGLGHRDRRPPRRLGLAAALPRRRPHDARLRRPRLLHDPGDAPRRSSEAGRGRRPPSAPPGAPDGPVFGRGPTNPLRDGVFLATTATGFLFTFVFCCNLSIFPLTVTQSARYPAVVFGLLAAVNGVLVAFFEISITVRLKPFRRLRLAALGCCLVTVGFGMIGLVMHWAWFLLAVLVFTAGEIVASPQQMAFIADWAPPEARGRYLSLYQATWSVAFAVNPAITLPLHAALGERAFWGLMPLLAIPGVFVLLRLDRTADRPERLRGRLAGTDKPRTESP